LFLAQYRPSAATAWLRRTVRLCPKPVIMLDQVFSLNAVFEMSTDKIYKQAIKRVFAEKYHDDSMAIYWGRDDDTIHVIASLGHYAHKIGSPNEDILEFVSSAGDRVVVVLTVEELTKLSGRSD